MTALILNSGIGSRMGMLTAEQPKCMTEISARETILSRQLQKLVDNGVNSARCNLKPLDVREMLCNEIDTPEDLTIISARLKEIENRTVYMGFGTDIIHSGHIKIIKRAQRLGKLIIGVLSDEAVSGYKRIPLLSFDERKELLSNITGVYKIVEQKTLSYRENLERYRPNFVVHGDDWRTGFLKPVRAEVIEMLASYGGQLVEFPYSNEKKYKLLNERTKTEFSLPDIRRAQLKNLLRLKAR